ncbi:MAG TPA: tetratricopeptide repeat protein [Chryseolinea sp.]|nr:tetratricopeptide repeat protein [Chryseolinea sp.]
MRYVLIILHFCIAGLCYAQSTLPDSIQQRYAGVKVDSIYITRLNSLSTDYLKTNPALSRRIASYVIEVTPKIKFTRGYARGLTVMGNSYWYEGIYEFAQNYYLLAARQYKNINDSVGLSQVYNNIGEVNKRLGETDKALEYLVRSLQLKKNDSTRDITLYNIGELYITTKEFVKATEYIKQSLAIAKSAGNERVIAYDYWSLARIKMAEGFESEAFSYFSQAEDLWKKLGEMRSLVQTYQDMATAYRRKGQLDQALEYLNKASELETKVQVPDLRITTYLEYFKIDSIRGNYKRAVYYLSRHNTLKDSVYNLLKAEQIARVQAIYETDVHERENEDLRIEKELKEAQLNFKNILIAAVSSGLILAGTLVWFLIRQRRKILVANKDLKSKNEEIHNQKNAIESQKAALQRLNEKLQELNKSLETRIEERSKQLLLQNQKLSDYVFINAHKLRGPVASILGLINLIQEVDPREQAKMIEHLKTCADQLDSIIREISKDLETAVFRHD